MLSGWTHVLVLQLLSCSTLLITASEVQGQSVEQGGIKKDQEKEF